MEIGYMDELQLDFSKELKETSNSEDFQKLLDKWEYWLDPESKELSGKDWEWMSPLLDDCRKEDTIPEDKHEPAIKLAMPERLFKVSIMASRFKVPWGCAYIRMKEEGIIDY